MEILIIGGTRFVGRAITQALADAGHSLTIAHRGTTPSPVEGARELLLDRNGDLSQLQEGRWDATIDVVAYEPHQVERLAQALDGRGGHHVLVSTISVYDADAREGTIDEQWPLLAAMDAPDPHDFGSTYGPLKVACERVARQHHPSLTIVRPGIVAGAFDPTDRFTWYVHRAMRDDRLRAPGAHDRPMQVIDARDLGAFVADLATRREEGVFNAVGSEVCRTIGDVVDAAREAVGRTVSVDWVSDDELRSSEQHLPLWTPADEPGMHRLFSIDPRRAKRAGLEQRPLADTARQVREWLEELLPTG